MRVPLFVVCFATSAIILLNGCNSKPGVNASVSKLEKAFAVAPAPAPTEQPAPGQAVRANTYVQFALAAVRSNDYAAAVVMLNNAVRAPGMTPDQFLVVQQARAALYTDLATRAERGDAGAQAAIKTIEQSRSH